MSENIESFDVTQYCYGAGENACTWHGNIQLAGRKDPAGGDDIGNRCCPKCGGELEAVFDESRFWALIRSTDNDKQIERMMRWSQGKCFENFDTLANAFRQAMEGQS